MENKKLFFLLSEDDGKKVFVLKTNNVWKIPEFDQRVPGNIAFDNPDPYLQWFEYEYGIPVFRRYIIESITSDSTYMILEPKDKKYPILSNYSWLPIDNLLVKYSDQTALYTIIGNLTAHYNKSFTLPWVNKNGYGIYTEWAIKTLRLLGKNPTGSMRQIKNAYVSSVFCCPTNEGDFYLKIPSNVYIREFEITKELKSWDIIQLPEWAAFDESTKTILMRDMGGSDLSADADKAILTLVVKEYAKFQKSAIDYINLSNPYPFYDLRASVLISRVESLVVDAVKLLQGSQFELDEKEVSNLLKKIPYWKKLCEQVQKYPIPYSLDHGDLRPGNIHITERGIIFFDWAWSAIAHPFFSICSFFHVIRRSISDSTKIHLRDVYLKEWQSFAAMGELLELFELVEQLRDLYCVLGDRDWLEAIQKLLAWQTPNFASPDDYTLERRQYYFARVLRRLI
ncbi:phosphotransferase [Paenibacillus eucommiae]|uniref:tRNA A-37 threonylcarbamoyl transferase component Bud32 n=1 Tax=Paenibacillus eucommiae TaxID=1355755 RepID=A0ABS4J5G0_9BACL|nr:phosphotransferase [Paenibacillus eucommiae]MBP1994346.1 tRNA A-37 threonylcarbamoyl transferase component Bud32 [Paenibacillus eucommiae]